MNQLHKFSEFSNWENCDPKSPIAQGQYGHFVVSIKNGQSIEIEIEGKWCPGLGHPFWTHLGDKNTSHRGYNKWSALLVMKLPNSILFSYKMINGSSFTHKCSEDNGEEIFIAMNDDYYDDNFNKVDEPMRFRFRIY